MFFQESSYYKNHRFGTAKAAPDLIPHPSKRCGYFPFCGADGWVIRQIQPSVRIEVLAGFWFSFCVLFPPTGGLVAVAACCCTLRRCRSTWMQRRRYGYFVVVYLWRSHGFGLPGMASYASCVGKRIE